MSVYERKDLKGKPLYIRFELAGIKVKRPANTTSRAAAKKLEEQLKTDLRKQLESKRRRHTWAEAVARFELENGKQRSWDRTKRDLDVLSQYWGQSWIDEITYSRLLETRQLLENRVCKGNGWKTTTRTWSEATVNRALAAASAVLNRAASKAWADPGEQPGTSVRWIDEAPEVPLFELAEKHRPVITREQVCQLLARFPLHTADISVLALATGLRRSNVTELTWDRIDMERRCCYIPGRTSKNGDPIPVPFNSDAMDVLERWQAIHEAKATEWSTQVRRYVFVYRQRAPIQQLTTKMWRRECQAVGLAGMTFHTLRHLWASWQAHAGTSTRIMMWLGGWKSEAMPSLYAHLDPGILANFANRTELPRRPTPDASGKGASKRKNRVTNAGIAGADGAIDRGPVPTVERIPSNGAPVPESVPDRKPVAGARVSACFGGKGGTRTLDPGIMSFAVEKKTA